MTKLNLINLSLGVLLSSAAFATDKTPAGPVKVDVEAQLKQLETNKENSAHNYEQYKKNMEIS